MKAAVSLLLCLLCGCVQAAEVNYSLNGTASSSVAHGSPSGSVDNIKDDDTETGYSVTNGGMIAPIEYIAQVELNSAYDITKAELVYSYYGTGSALIKVDIALYYGGTWHTIDSASYTTGNGSGTTTVNGEWDSVTRIRVSISGGADGGGHFLVQAGHSTLELRAWGAEGSGYAIIF